MKTLRTYLHEAEAIKLMILGGPGSGKSTYSEYISEHFDIPHIYPGDMLRKSTDPEVKALLAKGEFAPLDVVVKLIKQRLQRHQMVIY